MRERKPIDWPFAELHRSHARELADHMLRRQGRAAAGAAAILRVLSAMAEDAIDDRCATVNPFKGVRLRAGDGLAIDVKSATDVATNSLREAEPSARVADVGVLGEDLRLVTTETVVLPFNLFGSPDVALRATVTARIAGGYDSPSSLLPLPVSTF